MHKPYFLVEVVLPLCRHTVFRMRPQGRILNTVWRACMHGSTTFAALLFLLPSFPSEMASLRDFETKEKYIEFLEQRVQQLEAILFPQQAAQQCSALVSSQPSAPSSVSDQPSTQQLCFVFETPGSQSSKIKPSAPWRACEFSSRLPKDEEEWLAGRKHVRLCEPHEVIHTF